MRVRLWEALFTICLGLVVAVAIRLAGMMPVFALLVLPGYAALLARLRVGQALTAALLAAVVCGVAGVWLSFHWSDLPTSAITVALLGMVVLLGAGVGAWQNVPSRRRA